MNHLKLRSFILWLVFMVPLFAADQGPEQKTVEHAAKDKWIAIDKVQHFGYSLLVSLGCQYVLVNCVDKMLLPRTAESESGSDPAAISDSQSCA